MLKKLIATASAILLSFGLTACDPPMPPDVAAQILEQSYSCVEGNLTAKFPAEMADTAIELSDALASACVDPLAAMTFESVDTAEAELVISNYAPDAKICKPAFSIPFAVEAADVAFNLADSTTLNLTPKTLAKILTGKITNWNDQVIAEENDGTELPDLKISVVGKADTLALASFTNWMKLLKQDISSAKITGAKELALPELADGAVAIVPHSQVMANGLYAVSIIEGTNKESGEQNLAIADNAGIASAASQQVVKKEGLNLSVSLDAGLTPIAQAGMDEAAAPYQAIYPVMLHACGKGSQLQHAIALFLLRLDSQGVLAASNYNPLAESVRYESLDVARKGLPTPSPAAE